MRCIALVSFVLFGCGGFPTEIRVNLEIDDALLTSPGILSLRAFDDAGGIVHTQERPTGPEFPRLSTLQIQPLDGPTAWIELTLRRSDASLVREFALVYVDNDIAEHDLRLGLDCLGVVCSSGETCDQGECIAAGFCESEPRMCDDGRAQSCQDGVWAIRCE